MFRKLINLVIVLAVAASVASGIPMHSGSSDEGMMDCCKKALEVTDTPSVRAARLCCAINCNQPGSTGNNTNQSFSQTGPEASSSITLALPAASISKHRQTRYNANTSLRSNPTYILHLALLI